MELTVALDGEKKRDLRFFAGDDMSLTIVVYAHDGDVSPIAVTNVRFAAADGSLPMGSEFVVPSNFFGRVPYRIVGEVADITTTLAYGVMQTAGGWPSLFCWCAGPWPYGIVGKSDNITVLDEHQNFEGIVSVEGALQQLGDFKKATGDIPGLVDAAVQAASDAEAAAQAAVDTLDSTVKKPDLAAEATVPAYAFSAAEAQRIFDNSLPLPSQAALRAYTERAIGVTITQGGAWFYRRDPSDTTSPDNGGTVIVDALGRRWRYLQNGPAVPIEVFGAVPGGVVECGAAIQKALDFGGVLLLSSQYKTAQKLAAKKEGTWLTGSAAKWGSEVSSGSGFIADPSLNADFLLEFKNPVRGAMRSVGTQNIGIDCGTANVGGLAVRGAYDTSEFKNINIINVHVDRVGFEVSAGNTTTREGPVQTSNFKNIWALHRDGGVCTRPAVILGDIHESTAENIKGSHGSNTSTAEAFVIQSCNGVEIATPSAINVSGYGIMVRENFGPCVGVTIVGPTYEKCKQPFGTDSKDSRMFGSGLPIVALGSTVRQPADGSTASGVVWQSTAVGIYAKDTVGTFVPGNVYDGSGALIGNIVALASVGNSSIRHINPRTLSVNLSGAAQGVFTALSRSDIDLPMDTQTSPKHTYQIAADVANSIFREKEWGVTTNLSATSGIASGAGEIVLNYPANWPLSGTALNLADFAAQGRICLTKNGGALAVTVAGAGVSIGKYGVSTLTIYEGYLTLQRSSATSWEIVDIGGCVKDATQGMVCGIPRVVALTATTTFDSTAHDRVFTNTGAAAPVAINASITGSANAIGTRITLAKTVAQTFYFKPNAADSILGGTGAGKYVAPANVGDSVVLECVAASSWAIIGGRGTPAFEP